MRTYQEQLESIAAGSAHANLPRSCPSRTRGKDADHDRRSGCGIAAGAAGLGAGAGDRSYKAELKKNQNGETYIESAVNGSIFTIEFYGCEPGKGCGSLQSFA